MWKPAILAITLLAAAPAYALTNLLANPGFETGALAPWAEGRDGSNFGPLEHWTVTAAAAHSGRFGAEAVNNFELRQDFAPTPVSAIKQLSFWVEHPASEFVPTVVSYFYSDGTEGTDLAITLTTGWEFFDLTADLDPTRTLTGFSIFGYFGDPVPLTRFDDAAILVAGVPEPAAFALLGVGAALLAGVRRRAA